SADRRRLLRWLSCDERLKDRTDAGARRIAVAGFFQHPVVTAAAQDDIRNGRCALFSDEKMDLPRARRPEAREQSLLHDRVLNEIRLAVEVKAELLCARLAHCGDGREIPIVARADEHGGRAAPGWIGYANHRL